MLTKHFNEFLNPLSESKRRILIPYQSPEGVPKSLIQKYKRIVWNSWSKSTLKLFISHVPWLTWMSSFSSGLGNLTRFLSLLGIKTAFFRPSTEEGGSGESGGVEWAIFTLRFQDGHLLIHIIQGNQLDQNIELILKMIVFWIQSK